MSKIFGVKSIAHLIYGLLMLIPFLSVLSRCFYVSVNKNAYESYYGETINEKQTKQISNFNDLNLNDTYIFTNTSYVEYNAVSSMQVYFDNLINETSSYDLSNSTYFRLYPNVYQSNQNMFITFYDSNNTQIGAFNLVNNIVRFQFTILNFSYSNNTADFWLSNFYKYEYNKYSYLDNVFDYSISTFLDENDNYSIDFFSWFTDLFLNQETQHNALYLNFCNWYMNYALLVSTGYLLFFVLLWFVNYIRKILERSSYHDFGGF